ncbi:MAG TPA: SdrD B-like domain-containing protein [Stenotrophomonas sp.]|nr:SdrD B-like domain-containing protein [Stenotrophomonas sp.]
MDHHKRGGRPAATRAPLRTRSAGYWQLFAGARLRSRCIALAWLWLLLPACAMAADLQITNLSDTGYDPTPAGSTVVYRVTVENSAADTVDDVVVIFDLPAGAQAAAPLPAFCTVAAGNAQRLECRVGTLEGTFTSPDGAVSFQLPLATAGMAPGSMQMRGAIGFLPGLPAPTTAIASIADGDSFFAGDTNAANNRRVETTTLESAGDLSIEKLATPDPVVAGGQLTYTITVRNAGPSASSNFRVVDDLPAAVQYVASSFSGSGWTFDPATMTATHAGALASGGAASFSFRGRVTAGSGNVVNTARVIAGSTPDPLQDNNTASVNTAVTAGADLALTKSATPAPAISGEQVVFHIQVRNQGPSAAVNPNFVDNLPTGFVVTGGTAPAGWTCTDSNANTRRSCVLAGSLAVGAVADFTIESLVPASGTNSSGNVTNSATAGADTPDPNSTDNTGSTTFTVLADGADLSLQKTKTPALVPVWSGSGSDVDSRMTSRIVLRNLGPRPATGQVQVVDTLANGEELLQPDGVVATPGLAYASGAWTCQVDQAYSPGTPQHVTCDLAAGSLPLAVGAQAPQLQLLTRARSSAASLLNNACTGGSGGSIEPLTGNGIDRDAETGNDCSGAGTRTTDERSDLTIAKQTNGAGDADNVLAANQDTLSYTLTVTNQGPDATTGVVVNDTVPGFVTGRTQISVTSTPAGWNCTINGASVVCRSGTTALANGASAQIVIQVKRALFDSFSQPSTTCGGTTVSGAYCNTAGVGIDATVAGSVGELDGSNNQASDWIRIARVANVATTAKTIASGSPGQAGVNTTYVMSYLNAGPSSVPGVILRDVFTLPANDAGFVLISAQRTGAGTRTCNIIPGAGVTVSATAGGNSYANPTGAPAQVRVQCPALPNLANQQTETLQVVIRPNVNVGNTGRQFDNVADFVIDIDGDGNADATAGTDAGGNTYDFNSDPSDDSKSASLPFGSGAVDLITNKIDTEFPTGVDPLGYDAIDPSANLLTYQVTIRNNGPSVATNVRLSDSFTPPPGRTVTFIGAATTANGSYSAAACSIAAGSNPTTGAALQLDCLMPGVGFANNVDGVIASSQTSTLYLRYRYDTAPGASGDTVVNVANASAAEADTNTANNQATQETTIRAAADMGVSKRVLTTAPDADPDTALPANATSVSLRQPFFYVIDGVNNGPGASLSRDRSGSSPLNGTGTVVSDTLPAGLIVTGPATWQKKGPLPGGGEVPNGTGTCALAGSALNCTLGDVTVGGKLRIVVPVRWDSYPGAAAINNTVRVTTEQIDRNASNNTSVVPILVTRSSLAGTVFEDRDRAGANGGVRQGGEPGIGNVTISLTGTDAYGNAVNLSTTTAADGSYQFQNLSPADAAGYVVAQVQPASYHNGPVDPPAAGASAPSLGGTYAAAAPDSRYAAVPVGAADTAVRYDFPEVRQPSLSGHVYVDANFNDRRDAGSDGSIAGATVELLNQNSGAVLATTTTAADGSYRFDNLDPLVVYALRERLPTGGYRNRPSAVNPGLIGGAVCASGCVPGTALGGDGADVDRITQIDLGAGLDGTGFDFGEDAIAALSGHVYVDRNGNGDFDAGDAGSSHSQPNGGLQDVTITLTGAGADGIFGNADDPAPRTVQTDASGAYQFDQLVVGQHYRVSETQPTGYGDASEHANGVIDINALAAAGAQGLDFGEKLGSLAGVVFEDFSSTAASNNNGQFDSGERPIATVTLTLTGIDSQGHPVNLTTQSDAGGHYRFNDLLPPQAGGGYTLTQTQPAGYIDGKHMAGNAAMPGDASVSNRVDQLAIAAGQDASGYDFGELANVIISGKVYLDRNDDGDHNAGDAGIPSVSLTITGAGADGVFGSADDSSAQVSTDANGDYSYGGAVSGQDYRIEETQPTGLAEGRERPTNRIDLSNLPLAGSTGNDFGELAGALSGSVYLDANNNGVRDAGEPGIGGVSVQLPAGSHDALGQSMAAVVTAADGSYRFADLPAGTYSVTEQAAQPVVNGVTTLNASTRAGTIDGTPSGVATAVSSVPSAITAITLPAGKQSLANDFAETLPVSLAGVVFFDANNDGAHAGAAETGIANVLIRVQGTDDTGAAVQRDVQTDSQGRFVFEGLRPGQYQLVEPQQPAGTSNGITTPGQIGGVGAGTATPVATVPSTISSIDLRVPGSASIDNLFGEIPLNSGLSGRVWLDRNDDGLIGADESGIANVSVQLRGQDLQGQPVERDVVTDADGRYSFEQLPPGTYTVSEPQQPANTGNGRTVAGTAGGPVTPVATTPSSIAAIVLGVNQHAEQNNFGELPAGSIAGRVYADNNDNGQADNGEAGIGGVRIVLHGTDDLGRSVDATATTDAQGQYRFDGLRPGTYAVTEPEQPPHTLNGATNAGRIGGGVVGTATARDVLPSAISAIVLPIGAESLENNFGEIGDSPDLVVSKAATPERFTVNNDASYAISVRNVGQQPSRGEYTVSERLPAGVVLAAVPAGNGWTCSGAAGDTRFTCRSSAVIASGATAAERIQVPVRVNAAAATGAPVNNAVMVEGGGENDNRMPTSSERAAFDGDVSQLPTCDPAITQNACRLPTQVQLAASVSGTVWFESGEQVRILDGADQRLQGWTVELVDPASGQVARTATSAADGSYRIGDVIPGQKWQLRFRHPGSGVVWGWPVTGETSAGGVVSCAADSAMAAGNASACRISEGGISQLEVVLKAGENLPQQSLPVDPSGVVYDAVTRDPVPGSVVTFAPTGVCAGFDPASSVLNAASGGYHIEGNAISMTVGSDGAYQFLLGPAAPARCEFRLSVAPPGGYSFVSTLIPAQAQALSPPGEAGGRLDVQPDANPPTAPVGPATAYYLDLFAGSAVADIVHNHIPLDTAVATGLSITKTGDRQTAEIGDTVQYTITVRQTAGSPMQTVNVVDRLPRGFTYIEGTARANGAAAAEPVGKPGPGLGFTLGPIQVGQQIALTYRVRIGVGAQQGDGINRAQAHGCSIAGGCIDPVSLQPRAGAQATNQAQYRVRVTGGVFTEEGCVLGKVFVDCNGNHVQDLEEIGIPGVRLYFEDGTWVVSDSEGKYSYCGLPPQSHTLKVDASTLPDGARLTTSSNRNLGDADSLFIDLKNGELHRADFIEGSCANPVLEQVKARRTQGEVRAPERELEHAPLRFSSKPARAPQQATDTAAQAPVIVQPRKSPPPAASATGEVRP